MQPSGEIEAVHALRLTMSVVHCGTKSEVHGNAKHGIPTSPMCFHGLSAPLTPCTLTQKFEVQSSSLTAVRHSLGSLAERCSFEWSHR